MNTHRTGVCVCPPNYITSSLITLPAFKAGYSQCTPGTNVPIAPMCPYDAPWDPHYKCCLKIVR